MTREIKELCTQCQSVQPCRIVSHASGNETICNTCGHQVDFDINEEDDSGEPVGSCDNCGTNLYESDDLELCEQCLWGRQIVKKKAPNG